MKLERLAREIMVIKNELNYVRENEERIDDSEEKLELMRLEFGEKISQEVRNIKNEIDDVQISRAISRLLEEKEIKNNPKPSAEHKDTDIHLEGIDI